MSADVLVAVGVTHAAKCAGLLWVQLLRSCVCRAQSMPCTMKCSWPALHSEGCLATGESPDSGKLECGTLHVPFAGLRPAIVREEGLHFYAVHLILNALPATDHRVRLCEVIMVVSCLNTSHVIVGW